MKVVVAGGRGFIGSALVDRLQREGHTAIILSRFPEGAQFTWKQLQSEGLPECDGVVNLAGASVMAKRWTPAYKRKMFASRLDTTRSLVQAISKAKTPPEVFINASGIGYYPPHLTQSYTEESPSGRHLLGLLASQWESVARLPDGASTRLVVMRMPTVLGSAGGALKEMIPLFRKRLGGPIGTGDQPFPWIHIDDLLSLFLLALTDRRVTGPLNAVAPESVTQRDFAKALGAALNRKACLRTPEWFIKMVLGERASLLLEGQSAKPKKAEELGFAFRYPTLRLALAQILKN